MAGVDLNTVRGCLGHADLEMTLRHAHFAPEHKTAAVAKLTKGSGEVRKVADRPRTPTLPLCDKRSGSYRANPTQR